MKRFVRAEDEITKNPRLKLTCDRHGHVIRKQKLQPSPLKVLAHILALGLFITLSFIVGLTLLSELVKAFHATNSEQLSEAISQGFAALLFGVGAVVVCIK